MDGRSYHKSVVRVLVTRRIPNAYQPWSFRNQETVAGTGCILDEKRILTNAHVVSNSVFIEVHRTNDPTRFTARVVHVDHGLDLALLAVDEPDFFEDSVAVVFGDLPPFGANVSICGFPSGASELSTVAGVISRVEVIKYKHGNRRLIAIRTDAAGGPGYSGAPVFAGDDSVVGIAFQGAGVGGYIIPVTVVKDFVADPAPRIPDLGILWQRLENPSLRAWLKMQTPRGILVSRVLFESSADGHIAENDVLVSVDESPIAVDGTVSLRGNEKVEFTYLISRKRIGDSVAVELLRGGESRRCVLELRPMVGLVPPPRYPARASYLIVAGLVFMPLTHEYIRSVQWESVPARLRYYYFGSELPSPSRRAVIFINEVLPHEVNVGYHGVRAAIVTRINGIQISTLDDIAEAIRKPIDGYQVVELDDHGIPGDQREFAGTRIVLAADLVARATAEILERNDIARDRSDDVQP